MAGNIKSVCGGAWVTPKCSRSEGLNQTERENKYEGMKKSNKKYIKVIKSIVQTKTL